MAVRDDSAIDDLTIKKLKRTENDASYVISSKAEIKRLLFDNVTIENTTNFSFLFRRNYYLKKKNDPQFNKEFGHIEGDTIIGVQYKSAGITLMERLPKVIITLKPNGRKASDIELAMDQWFQVIPRNLFHSITFDCGK